MILRIIASAIGGIVFGILFGVPKKYFFCCGFCAGIGWTIYLLLTEYLGVGNSMATLGAAIGMAFFSRFFAVLQGCPNTVFLMCGTIPLVPGAKVFWMSYYMVIGNNMQSLNNGLAAMKAAGAIVLGIVLVFEIPSKFFAVTKKSNKQISIQ